MKPRIKPNITMLLVFLAVVLSPYLIAYLNGQEPGPFDWITMLFLVLFALTIFVWWKKRRKINTEILDDIDEDMIDDFLD